MSVEVIDKIKPKNGGNFKIVDSIDVEMSDGKSLQETVTNLSEKLDDVSNGKFEGSEKYYTMAEVIAKYYNKEEVDLLIQILESEIDEFTTEDDIKSLIASYYPIELSQINHDFDIYVKKAQLKDELDKLLVDYQPGSSINDLEEALENYYTKTEVYTKTETNAQIDSAITSDKISNLISNRFYDKEQIDDFLNTKLDSSVSTTIDDISNTLTSYIESNSTALSDLETRVNNTVAESVSSKVNTTDFTDLKSNYEDHIKTFTNTVKNLCTPDKVRDIIDEELESGESLDTAIKTIVSNNYQTLSDRIEQVKTDQGLYATVVYVSQELNALKALINGLSNSENTSSLTDLLDSYLVDLNNRVAEIIEEAKSYTDNIVNGYDITEGEVTSHVIGLKEQINEINSTIGDKTKLGEKDIASLIEEIKSNLNNLNEAKELLLAEETGKIPVIEGQITQLSTNIESNDSDIAGLTTNLNNLKTTVEGIKLITDGTGFNKIREDLDNLTTNFNTLNANIEQTEDETDISYPIGSVYDKIFNHPSMIYQVEIGGDDVANKQFTATEFLNKIKANEAGINSLTSRISEVSTGAGELSTRVGRVEGSVYEQNGKLASMEEKVNVIDKYDEHLANLDNVTKTMQEQLNEVDKVTASSIVTKINNSEENIKITSNNLDLRGAVNYNSLNGDISSLLLKNTNGVFINGRMIGSKSIPVNNIDFKGLSVTSYEKIDSTTKTSFESFRISDLGKVTIINPTIISTDFKTNEPSGFQLLPEGKAYFNNAEIKGKIIMPNSGIDGLSSLDKNMENEVRIWAGSTEENKSKAPFRIHQNGFMFASNASIGGSIASNEFHNGSVHMIADEIKINNKFMFLDNESNKIQSLLAGSEEKEYVTINSRQIKLNSNLEVGDSLRCINSLKTLEVNSKLEINNDETEIKIDNNGVKLFTDHNITNDEETVIETVKARHTLYQDKNTGSLVFESNNKSNLASPDFRFASRNSKRDCNMYVQGNLTVTEEIKSNKNNVVMRSTENGFAFFAL